MSPTLQTQTKSKSTSLRAPQHMVSGLLQRKCACGGSGASSLTGECEACKKKRLKKKLVIGASNDPLEQEADRVADQVMGMSLSHGVRSVPPRIQRFTGQGSDEVGAAPASVDRVLANPGGLLDSAVQRDMGRRFGYDFSNVRIHSDAEAEQSARDVNAHAYTVGRDIVFAAGQYAPSTAGGRRLLAHELVHMVQQGAAGASAPATRLQRGPAERPTSESVWGLLITRSMCGCRDRIRNDIAWANAAGATYAACDTPANTTGVAVEACFNAAQPGTTVVGSTSSSGTVTLPPPSADPCERIANKSTFVHETMHARHTDAIARARGTAFFRDWRRLAGDPNRLDTLRATFPAQVAAFEAQWQNGHDWAQDEVNSYRWERRFLEDALRALNHIC